MEQQLPSVIEEEESFYQDIDLLQTHGINVADIKKLKSAGICTVKGIQMITKKKLCNIKGLSEAKVEKIKEAVLKVSGGGASFCTALQTSINRRNVFNVQGDLSLVCEIFISRKAYNFSLDIYFDKSLGQS